MSRLLSQQESDNLDADGLRHECQRLREMVEGCMAETEVLYQFLVREGYDPDAIMGGPRIEPPKETT